MLTLAFVCLAIAIACVIASGVALVGITAFGRHWDDRFFAFEAAALLAVTIAAIFGLVSLTM